MFRYKRNIRNKCHEAAAFSMITIPQSHQLPGAICMKRRARTFNGEQHDSPLP